MITVGAEKIISDGLINLSWKMKREEGSIKKKVKSRNGYKKGKTNKDTLGKSNIFQILIFFLLQP